MSTEQGLPASFLVPEWFQMLEHNCRLSLDGKVAADRHNGKVSIVGNIIKGNLNNLLAPEGDTGNIPSSSECKGLSGQPVQHSFVLTLLFRLLYDLIGSANERFGEQKCSYLLQGGLALAYGLFKGGYATVNKLRKIRSLMNDLDVLVIMDDKHPDAVSSMKDLIIEKIKKFMGFFKVSGYISERLQEFFCDGLVLIPCYSYRTYTGAGEYTTTYLTESSAIHLKISCFPEMCIYQIYIVVRTDGGTKIISLFDLTISLTEKNDDITRELRSISKRVASVDDFLNVIIDKDLGYTRYQEEEHQVPRMQGPVRTPVPNGRDSRPHMHWSPFQ